MEIVYIVASTVIICLYFFYNLQCVKHIMQSSLLSPAKKIMHACIIWIVPIVWYYLFKDFYGSSSKAMTKVQRDALNAKSGGYHESKVGIYG